MRRQLEHRQQGIFVAEGEKVVQRLLQSPLQVISVVMPERCLERNRLLLESRPETIEVYLGEKPLLEQMTGFSMYQGVMAVGQVPTQASLLSVLESCPRPRLFAAVDGITSAENMGALVRNCVAFGAHAILTGETSCSPFLRRAVRNSMGTVFKLPVVEVEHLAQALAVMRQQGVRLVAAHPHENRRTLAEANLAGEACLVFGSEGDGIAPGILELCDEAVAIPMAHEVDSLNVACAGAVFLYEASRQRALLTTNKFL